VNFRLKFVSEPTNSMLWVIHTAAIGKGFAIGSAALTALALFGAYMTSAGITSIDISEANVMAGIFVGGMLAFVFSALSMNAVGRAAKSMIEEVRRQFANTSAEGCT
jgi:K(+)-stimulated pyrophosphate-energized sodium pump